MAKRVRLYVNAKGLAQLVDDLSDQVTPFAGMGGLNLAVISSFRLPGQYAVWLSQQQYTDLVAKHAKEQLEDRYNEEPEDDEETSFGFVK